MPKRSNMPDAPLLTWPNALTDKKEKAEIRKATHRKDPRVYRLGRWENHPQTPIHLNYDDRGIAQIGNYIYTGKGGKAIKKKFGLAWAISCIQGRWQAGG